MNLPRIILLSGKAEAGKTAAANMIKRLILEGDPDARVAIIPYANRVKETAKLLFDWDGAKDEKGRRLLQWWGTDVVRSRYPDYWVHEVIGLVTVARDQLDYVIIDDCRFPNELDWWNNVWECGYFPNTTIRIERPGHENSLTPEQRLHPSETALDDYEHDIVISAETLPELEGKLFFHVVEPMLNGGGVNWTPAREKEESE